MKESLITPPLIHLKDMKGCRDSHVIKLLFWAVQFILGSVVTAVAMLEKENCFCFAGFLWFWKQSKGQSCRRRLSADSQLPSILSKKNTLFLRSQTPSLILMGKKKKLPFFPSLNVFLLAGANRDRDDGSETEAKQHQREPECQNVWGGGWGGGGVNPPVNQGVWCASCDIPQQQVSWPSTNCFPVTVVVFCVFFFMISVKKTRSCRS